jgi:hypothetical protein
MPAHGIHVAGVRGRPDRDRTVALLSPPLTTRVRARLRRLELDRALAGGADPSGSPLLAARAAQLVTPASRDRIALSLEQVACTADAPRGRVRTPPLRGAVRRNRDALQQAAATLRDGGLLYARGVAVLEALVIDGAGPAYTDPTGEGLAHQLQLAADNLTG